MRRQTMQFVCRLERQDFCVSVTGGATDAWQSATHRGADARLDVPGHGPEANV
jgi:hypothetical protein